VSRAYAEVNRLFGDIVKVTPTSKVVGDMAIMMVANDLAASDVSDPQREIAFPESVVSLFRGELGFPPDGFPPELSRKVLKEEPPAPYRPGDRLPPVDLAQAHKDAEKVAGRQVGQRDLSSYLMYPKVFKDYWEHRRTHGDVSNLPTSVFFYGMREREEVAIDIDPGKTLIVRLQGMSPPDEEGTVRVFFELNGQPRTIRVHKAGIVSSVVQRPKAEAGNAAHVAAPMPGMVVTVSVREGQLVKNGDPLVSIEAMKMESQIRCERDGTVKSVHVKPGETVSARDLLIELSA
jgi:pyruvate carboxylase